MYVITVEFIIKESHIESFKKRMLQQANDSLKKEKDCFYFDVCFDEDNLSRVFLYEIYKDENAFNIHLKVHITIASMKKLLLGSRKKLLINLKNKNYR